MRMLSSRRRRVLCAGLATWRWIRAHVTNPDLPATLLVAGLAVGCDADLGRLVAGAWCSGILGAALLAVAPPVLRPSPGRRARARSLARRFARGRVTLALVAAALCLPGAPLAMGPGPAFLPDWHGAMPIDNCLRTVPLAAWFLFAVAALQTFIITLATGPTDPDAPAGGGS